MSDLLTLQRRKQELMQAEQQQAQRAQELAQIDAQIVAARRQQQQLMDVYNDIAARYGEANIAALNHLGAMIEAVSLPCPDIGLARSEKEQALKILTTADQLFASAQRQRQAPPAGWHDSFERHLSDPDIQEVSFTTHQRPEIIAEQRANRDCPPLSVPTLPPLPTVPAHFERWIGATAVNSVERQIRRGLCLAVCGDIFDPSFPATCAKVPNPTTGELEWHMQPHLQYQRF